MIRAALSSTAASQTDVGRNRKSKTKFRVPNNESKSKISELEQKFWKFAIQQKQNEMENLSWYTDDSNWNHYKIVIWTCILIYRIYLNSSTTVYFRPKIKLPPLYLPFQIFHYDALHEISPFFVSLFKKTTEKLHRNQPYIGN